MHLAARRTAERPIARRAQPQPRGNSQRSSSNAQHGRWYIHITLGSSALDTSPSARRGATVELRAARLPPAPGVAAEQIESAKDFAVTAERSRPDAVRAVVHGGGGTPASMVVGRLLVARRSERACSSPGSGVGAKAVTPPAPSSSTAAARRKRGMMLSSSSSWKGSRLLVGGKTVPGTVLCLKDSSQ